MRLQASHHVERKMTLGAFKSSLMNFLVLYHMATISENFFANITWPFVAIFAADLFTALPMETSFVSDQSKLELKSLVTNAAFETFNS